MTCYLCERIKTAKGNGDKQRVLRQGNVGLQVEGRKVQPAKILSGRGCGLPMAAEGAEGIFKGGAAVRYVRCDRSLVVNFWTHKKSRYLSRKKREQCTAAKTWRGSMWSTRASGCRAG